MTARHEPPPNPLATAAWVAGTIAAGVTILLWRHPELWLWVAAVWAVSGLLGLGIVAAEARAEASGLRDQLEAEREAAARRGDVARVPLTVSRELFSDAEPRIEDRIRAHLRAVPTQSAGEHDRLALSREEWAAIERETREL